MNIDLVWEEEAYDEALVHYDALISVAGRGTVALSYCPDRLVPWPLRGVHRWREGDLVRVNNELMKFEQAMACIESSWQDGRTVRRIIDACLMAEALRELKIDVTDTELQEAMDTFRQAHGLLTVESTEQWMRENGTDQDQLEERLTNRAAVKKLRDQVIARREETYFAAHRRELDIVCFARMSFPDEHQAQTTVEQLRNGKLDFFSVAARQFALSAAGSEKLQSAIFENARRRDLAPELEQAIFSAAPGDTVGAFKIDGQWSLFHITSKSEAQFDLATRSLVRDILFDEWLESRRRSAKIEWNWGRN